MGGDARVVEVGDGMRDVRHIKTLIDFPPALEIDSAGKHRHVRDDVGRPCGDAVSSLVGHSMVGDGDDVVIIRRDFLEPAANSAQPFVGAFDGPDIRRSP